MAGVDRTVAARAVLSFVWAGLMMIAAGTQYAFSAYSPDLRTILQVSQGTISAAASSMQMGLYVCGIVPGGIFDVVRLKARQPGRSQLLRNRAAPIAVLLLSAVMHLIGFGGVWLLTDVDQEVLKGQPTWVTVLLYVSFFCIGIGSASLYTASLSPQIHTANNLFPSFRGVTVGCLVTFFGASAAVFAALYSAFFAPEAGSLLGFLALVTVSVSVIGMLTVAEVEVAEFYTAPVCPSSRPKSRMRSSSRSPSPSRASAEQGQGQPPVRTSAEHGQGKKSKSEKLPLLQPGKEIRIEGKPKERALLQAALTIEFWFLFIAFGLMAGSGFVIFNQLGELNYALGGGTDPPSALVITLSVCNALSRVGTGLIGDAAMRTCRLPRAWWIVSSGLIMTFSHVWLSFVEKSSDILIAVIACGIGYGSLMAATPTVLCDAYGVRYFASNWAALRAAPAAGSLFLATLLASKVYDAHTPPGETRCSGPECFRVTFIVSAALSLLSVLMATIAAIMLPKRLKREEAEANEQVFDDDGGGGGH